MGLFHWITQRNFNLWSMFFFYIFCWWFDNRPSKHLISFNSEPHKFLQMMQTVDIVLRDLLNFFIQKRNSKMLKNSCQMSNIRQGSEKIFPNCLRDDLRQNQIQVDFDILLHAIHNKSLNICKPIPTTTLRSDNGVVSTQFAVVSTHNPLATEWASGRGSEC
ncbi:hypothetical protein Taro_051479 [Colocasia esculenta]|uniref:Uncharacterized protein n=1 Tax=Colocasia esculenta TaxID=4460 RepID=A0A843XH42_COLES|nr:hypothetical protein [Colocasia esculenta]